MDLVLIISLAIHQKFPLYHYCANFKDCTQGRGELINHLHESDWKKGSYSTSNL